MAGEQPALVTRILLNRIGYSNIFTLMEDASVFFYEAGMMIDADGAPKAYHPDNKPGLDYLGNAGTPGDWWALVTDNGRASGNPIVQGENDPAPGFYISTTALEDNTKKRTDPLRYVDASTIPFIVLPGNGRFGAALSDFCMVYNPKNQKMSGGVFADIGPRGKIGEASVAMAAAVGIASDAKHGGIGHGLIYIVFKNSATGWPKDNDAIQEQALALFEEWGGMNMLQKVMPDVMIS